jgi:hypothetical protein
MTWSLFPIAGLKIGTASIVSPYSTNGYTAEAIGATQIQAKADLSGAMTEGTLKTYLSRTGEAGELTSLAYKTNDTTSRMVRFKITVDGSLTPTYDAVSAAITNTNRGAIICGVVSVPTNYMLMEIPKIYYKSSILVEYSSSVTETDKLTIFCSRAVYR